MRSLVVAGVCIWALIVSRPGAGLHGQGLLLSALLIVATLGWLTGIFLDRDIRVVAVGAAVSIGAGVAIFGLGPNPTGLVYVGSALVTVAVRLPTRWAVTYAVATAVAYTTAEMLGRANFYWIGGGLGGIALSALSGAIRRQAEERTKERELLLAEQAQSAALAERARIAREIHDVLAHTLTALFVQLEAARLLDRERTSGEFRDQVLERVVAARSMAREGLAETRQALSALRGDVPPVEEHLRQMVAAVEPGEVTVSGERAEADGRGRANGLAGGAGGADQCAQARAGGRRAVRLEYLPGRGGPGGQGPGRPSARGRARCQWLRLRSAGNEGTCRAARRDA